MKKIYFKIKNNLLEIIYFFFSEITIFTQYSNCMGKISYYSKFRNNFCYTISLKFFLFLFVSFATNNLHSQGVQIRFGNGTTPYIHGTTNIGTYYTNSVVTDISVNSPGQFIDCFVRVQNVGAGAAVIAGPFDVYGEIPNNFTYVTNSCNPVTNNYTSSNTSAPYNFGGLNTGNGIKFTLPSGKSLAVGATVYFYYKIQVVNSPTLIPSLGDSVQGVYVKGAFVKSSSGTTYVNIKQANLAVTNSVTPSSATAGDLITYTIQVQNLGTEAANNVELTSVLSPFLTYVSSSGSVGAYSNITNKWIIGTITNGSTVTLTINARVAGNVTGTTISNTASISAVNQFDGVTSNNSASSNFTVYFSDLNVTKTVNNPIPDEGETVIYTITASNIGTIVAPSVTVNDLLPSGLTFSAVNTSKGTYNSTSGIWSVGNLVGSESATMTLSATVNSNTAAQTIINQATISANVADTDFSNNEANVNIKVKGADLALSNVLATTQALVGNNANYIVTLTNNGPDIANNVVINYITTTDALIFVNATQTQGTYNNTTGIWNVGTLNPGQTITLNLNYIVSNSKIINTTASVANSSEPDSIVINNIASNTVTALVFFNAGACIIDMGVVPQTINNGLKPYGLIYDIVTNYKVPVYWAINPHKNFTSETNKVDQIDFSLAGKDYRGGSFIIPAEYMPIVQTVINTWVSNLPGLTVDFNRPQFTAPVYDIITSYARGVLDAQNGDKIIDAFYDTSGVSSSSVVSRDGAPSNLGPCDDFYAMPHADPSDWNIVEKQTFSNFINNGGWLWAGCHAVSDLETNVDLNNDGFADLNFLSNDGLILWNDHDNPDPPYNYSLQPTANAMSLAADPLMQFMGTLDNALDGGSEQVYLPNSNGWRSTTTIGVYDQDHLDIPSLSPGKAALLAFGRAFGDNTKGFIMYESSHDISGGSESDQVAAARAYGNFMLMAGIEFKPKIYPEPINLTVYSNSTITLTNTVLAKTNPFTALWTSSCGGVFSNPTSLNTSFTAPSVNVVTTCILRLVVTDACGRINFLSHAIQLTPIADLRIVKTVSTNPTFIGGNLTYTVTVTNNGPNTSSNVIVEDIIPSQLTLISATPSIGSWSNPNWSIGTLTSGQQVSIAIVARVNPGTPNNSTVSNTASVTSSTHDPNLINNTSTANTLVIINPIDAVNDTAGTINGFVGGTALSNVLNNDTLNGASITSSQVTTTFVSSSHPNITLSGNSVVVGALTPIGNYTLVYQICEVLNPTNCDQATVVIPVTNATINANDDNGSMVNGYIGGTSFTNILINDTINGIPVNASNVTITFISTTNPGISLSGANVIVAAGTPANNYSLTYQICDSLNPINCDTAIVYVPVGAPIINAINDSGSSVNGYIGGTSFSNVLLNDTLNGTLVNPSEVTTSFISSTDSGITLLGSNVMVASGTPAGNYILTYQICEILNPTNCDQASVTVPVTAPLINAVNDLGNSINGYVGGTAYTNVLINDTLNNVAVNESQINTTFVSSSHPNIILSGTDVIIAPGTPAGNYLLTYQICEIINPTNCDTATVSNIVILATTIDAINDTGAAVNGYDGGTSYNNVLSNDTLNGTLLNPTQVNLTFISSTHPGITLSSSDVIVLPNTPAGNYTLTYQICEKLNPTNCDTATVTVQVTAPDIDAINDSGQEVNGYNGGISLTNVLSNDTLDNIPVIPSEVVTTFVSSTNSGISLSGTNVVVAPGTPAGAHTLTYSICLVLNPSVCDTAVVNVPVTAPIIQAIDDLGTTINGYVGGTSLTDVLTNDTLNGSLVNASQVNLTFISSTNAGITLSGSDVIVAAGTPAGSYTLTYQICDVLNTANCDTAIVTVIVTAAPIVANDDAGATINGISGGTAFTNVLVNDTLNGVLVNASQVNTTFISATNAETVTVTIAVSQFVGLRTSHIW